MATGQWWVLAPAVVGRGQKPFNAIQSATRPKDTSQAHVVAGPFATQADAQAWINKQTAIPNPAAGIWEVGAVLKAFFQQITRVEMWRSLGWIVGGAILVLAGAVLWLRKEGVIPDAVPIPV